MAFQSTNSKPFRKKNQQTVLLGGALLWNNMPKSLKNAAFVEHFKRNTKKVADISDFHTATTIVISFSFKLKLN